ncbi:MAG: substrate-binding domain-containing protein [Pseudobutyrivibrio sp.]|nr:substrate-binding domain-containing protein [Pseudobutyrivibrio sp.]
MIFKNNTKRRKYNRSSTLMKLSTVAVCCMVLTTIVSFIMLTGRMSEVKKLTAPENYDTYDKYVCMITSDDEGQFWQEVYQVAKDAGKEMGICVDMLSDTINIQQNPAQLLNIAIASHPDGIILEANSSDEMTIMLEKANEADIPIVTVLSDGMASDRISYISVNNYTLGQIYGSQVIGVAEKNANVLILTRSDTNAIGENLIITGIQDTIMDSEEYRNINITSNTIIDDDAFAIEESVRNIFMHSRTLPDVIICLDEQITTCVYQAMIDYNKVGQVQLLGYYDSDTILEGVRQGVIHSTIAVDTAAMGQDCVDAFAEYWESGYVSEYYDVDAKLITIENINSVVKEGNNE